MMFLTHAFENPEREMEVLITKREGMFGAQGGLQHQISISIQQECSSFHKFLLTFMLIYKNVSLLKKMKKCLFKMDLTMPVVDGARLKDEKFTARRRPGNLHNVQGSNDCLIAGLYDDVVLECLALACRSDYPALSCLNKSFNLLVGSGYLYKLRRQLGIFEHWVYLSCSLMPWEAFDPTRMKWMRLPRMPCDECFSCADKESLAVGTQLLVFGRELTGFAIWMYSLVRRDWSRCPLMNLPRCLFGSGSCGEISIVAGGSDRVGLVLKCAEMYNSELGRWESLPDMNIPRKMCSGFFMDGKFYVIGGMSSHTDSLTCGEEYNLDTRTWRRIHNMYPGGNRATHQSPPLVAVVNNQLYAADQSTNEVKKYDKLNNTWNFVKPLPMRADSYNGWGLAFKACGDKLLVIGGHRGPQGEVILLRSWHPEDRNNRGPEWDVLSVRERAGAFVYNCAIMGC